MVWDLLQYGVMLAAGVWLTLLCFGVLGRDNPMRAQILDFFAKYAFLGKHAKWAGPVLILCALLLILLTLIDS